MINNFMEKRAKGRPRVLEPHIYKLNVQWARARCQARYLGIDFTITVEEWKDLWLEDDKYLRKGRGLDNLIMVRVNPEGAWDLDNVEILSRREWHKRYTRGKIRELR